MILVLGESLMPGVCVVKHNNKTGTWEPITELKTQSIENDTGSAFCARLLSVSLPCHPYATFPDLVYHSFDFLYFLQFGVFFFFWLPVQVSINNKLVCLFLNFIKMIFIIYTTFYLIFHSLFMCRKQLCVCVQSCNLFTFTAV